MSKLFLDRLATPSLILALAFSPLSYAGKADFAESIKIASTYQSGDGIAKKFLYRGSVTISQGTLKVSADEVEVDGSRGEGNEIFIARGEPAQYSQQQEDGSIVKASARRIEYRRDTRALTLDGKALIEQNNSSVQGESISFNMQLEQIIAQGEDGSSGRVVTVFQPEKKAPVANEKKEEKP